MKQKTMKLKKYMKVTAKLAIVAVLAVSLNMGITKAQASSVTRFSDTMSRLHSSIVSNHEIQFNSPSGITASSKSIILTFSSGFTGVSGILYSDVDFALGSAACQSSPTFTEQTLAATPSGTTWGVTSSGQAITILSGTSTATAGNCMRIRIGTNAVTGSTGVNQITNGPIGTNDTITLSGTFGDTGTLSVDIITNDQITVSATVDPSITFALSDQTVTNNAIGFGNLSTATACYAVANEATTGCTTSDPAAGAATATITTNASTGYVLSYYGDTLKSGTDTIAAVTISGDADGTPGAAAGQFATSYDTSGTAFIYAGYEKASNNWKYVTNTTSPIASNSVPVNSEVIKMHYLANISGLIPAGAYSTTITYIATGSF